MLLLEWQEEDYGAGYLVQPVGQSDALNSGVVADVDGGNDEGEEEDEVDDDDEDVQVLPPDSSHLKRKRNDEEEDDEESDDEDVVAFTKSSKKHHWPTSFLIYNVLVLLMASMCGKQRNLSFR